MALIDAMKASARRAKYVSHEADITEETGFLVCDRQGRILLCSPLAAALLRRDPAGIEGLSVGGLFPARHDERENHSPGIAGPNVRSGWLRVNAASADGHPILVETSMMDFEIERVPLFLLHLRRSVGA